MKITVTQPEERSFDVTLTETQLRLVCYAALCAKYDSADARFNKLYDELRALRDSVGVKEL